MGSGEPLLGPPRNAPLEEQFTYWDELSKRQALTTEQSVRFERVIRDLDYTRAIRQRRHG
jgi:hypothetical protein